MGVSFQLWPKWFIFISSLPLDWLIDRFNGAFFSTLTKMLHFHQQAAPWLTDWSIQWAFFQLWSKCSIFISSLPLDWLIDRFNGAFFSTLTKMLHFHQQFAPWLTDWSIQWVFFRLWSKWFIFISRLHLDWLIDWFDGRFFSTLTKMLHFHQQFAPWLTYRALLGLLKSTTGDPPPATGSLWLLL